MPRIRDEYLNCAVYLYRSRHEAEEAINIGGSGFIVSVPAKTLPKPEGFVYAVTNKHVIRQGACCMRVNMVGGGFDLFEIPQGDWILSPTDDLAICLIPFLTRDKYQVGTVGYENLITEKIVREWNFGPGDEVVLIGRFISQEGKQRNLPTVRFGHIAQMPYEPLEYDGVSQESFLCEVKSIGGFSGSPVFVAPILPAAKADGTEHDKQSFLLGVDWCHMRSFDHPIDVHGHEMPHMQIPVNTGMMGVVPAWKLIELIESPQATGPRQTIEATVRKFRRMSVVKQDSSSVSEVAPLANDANPNHREDFMRLVGAAAQKPEPKG
jgi:hypothetical protein